MTRARKICATVAVTITIIIIIIITVLLLVIPSCHLGLDSTRSMYQLEIETLGASPLLKLLLLVSDLYGLCFGLLLLWLLKLLDRR